MGRVNGKPNTATSGSFRGVRFGFLDWALVACAVCVFVLAGFLNFRYGAYNAQRISTSVMDVHADFDTFHRSARALLQGENIYGTGARLMNLNPPFWTVLLAPLGLIEPLLAFRVFDATMVALMVFSLMWVVAELRMRGWWAVVAVVLLLVSSPMFATLALGQLYPLLALGLVAAWVWERKGRPLACGVALGLVVAIKPSLLPVLLWPAARRRWRTVLAALGAGAVATMLAVAVAGPETTFGYARMLLSAPVNPFWDNASMPATAARLFTENDYAVPLAVAPLMVPVAYLIALGALVLTVLRVGVHPELGLWATVAATLLVSPIAWNNYLMLLGPGLLVLVATGRVAPALLLLALQLIPAQWPLIWDDIDAAWASIPLSLYSFSLIAHWLVFLYPGPLRTVEQEAVPRQT